ncbi:MAG TPA: DUF1573 domain-containing protein [Phycisphaerales bacterium]|nr:DUF1573 domain-containing protein [Phycisphaerales bacterium]HMP38332.1 DUF1573 domain-containing protein [Phycisphaerales bacterium]
MPFDTSSMTAGTPLARSGRTAPRALGARRGIAAVAAAIGMQFGALPGGIAVAQAPPQRPPATAPERPAAAPPARPAAAPAGRQAATGQAGTPQRRATPVNERIEGLRPRTPGPRVPYQGGPAIWFEVLDHDFELMTNAETRNATFRFHNVGDSPLQVIDVVASCGCTRPIFAKATYQPGESGVIEVAFTPPTGGHQAKSLKVLTNAKSPGEVVNIRVIGEVDTVLAFSPQTLDLGEVRRGQGKHMEFELVADAPVTVFQNLSLNPRAQHIAASFTDPLGKREGKAGVEVSIGPDAPWGFFRTGLVEIEVVGKLDNGEPVSKRLPVRILATVVDDIRASAYIIQLGQSHYGDLVKGETIITSVDGEEFEIVDPKLELLSSTNRGVADFAGSFEILPYVDPEKPEVKGYKIVISGTVGNASGFVSGSLEFGTRIKGATAVTKRSIGLNGRVDEPGRTFTMPSRG